MLTLACVPRLKPFVSSDVMPPVNGATPALFRDLVEFPVIVEVRTTLHCAVSPLTTRRSAGSQRRSWAPPVPVYRPDRTSIVPEGIAGIE